MSQLGKLSIKITAAGTYLKDKWHSREASKKNRVKVLIMNNGVDNDLTTGMLYVSLLDTSAEETEAITTVNVIPLAAGDWRELAANPDIYINVQGDTDDMNIYIEELEGLNPYVPLP